MTGRRRGVKAATPPRLHHRLGQVLARKQRGAALLVGILLLALVSLVATGGATARPADTASARKHTGAPRHHKRTGHHKHHKRHRHHRHKHKHPAPAGSQPTTSGQWTVLSNPIDPAQELDLPFGTRSQWLQPWRAYLDTPPASEITNGLGINWNVVGPKSYEPTAAALENAGFTQVRIGIPWNSLDPNNPSQLAPGKAVAEQALLAALVRHHLRPLILLDANSLQPTPNDPVTLHIAAPAPANSTTVLLSSASAAAVVPGRTGFSTLNGGGVAAGVLITSVRGTLATLSQPLDSAVSPGDYQGFTLAYAPFTDPGTSLPSLNASFNTTLQGWLAYVQTVGNFVRSAVGGDNFDMEVWNELSFGSQFLNINAYYSPPVDPLAPPRGPDGNTLKAILAATAAEIQQDFPGVGIGDGFSDQEPYTNGASVPPGVNIDRHYYESSVTYPQDAVFDTTRPVDWFGRNFGTYQPQGPGGTYQWTDFWVPSYTADFPELWLTGLTTENVIRDLTPLSETIGGAAHGRYTHPPGAPPPQVWMTETNLGHPTTMTPDQAQRFQAKVALRYLLANINKGLGRVYYYAITGGNLSLATQSFVDAAEQGQSTDPGLTFDALGRLTQYIHSDPTMQPRSIQLLQIATTDTRNIFDGFGQFPPLRNLDATAFFPFQESTHQFVFAAYVMTRDLGRAWQAPGPNEFDMPPAPYRFEIGNIDGCHTQLTGYDPVSGQPVPVQVVSCAQNTLTFQTNLTDSPVLIQATEVQPPAQNAKPAHHRKRSRRHHKHSRHHKRTRHHKPSHHRG